MIISAPAGITPVGRVADIWLRIEGGIIREIGTDSKTEADLKLSGTLIPAFVDIHCHGGGGFYFSDPQPANIARAIELHRNSGTATLFASLVTATPEETTRQITELKEIFVDEKIAGIHLEGPYLSPQKCGAHEPALLRAPKVSEIQGFLAAGQGAVSMITIAPELHGAIDAIKFIVSQGVIAAIGHTDSSPDQCAAAIEAGASVVTHFNNAMNKRKSSPLSAADFLLENSQLPLEVILDGVHLSEDVTAELLGKYSDKLIAVTDAMSAAGCADGNFQIGNLNVTVKNQIARLESNGALAGSTLTMKRVFQSLIESGVDINTAVNITSTNAANLLKNEKIGRIEIGAKAELLHFQEGNHITRVEVGH